MILLIFQLRLSDAVLSYCALTISSCFQSVSSNRLVFKQRLVLIAQRICQLVSDFGLRDLFISFLHFFLLFG